MGGGQRRDAQLHQLYLILWWIWWCGRSYMWYVDLSTGRTQLGMGGGVEERDLYVDNGRIAGRYHEWVQDALSVTVEMF